MTVRVPFLDLHAANAPVEAAFFRELKRLYRASAFIGGPEVERFEAAFAEAMGAPHCVAVSSGTAAIELSLVAAGVKAGDEVIVPAFTFPGAAGPVLRLGARPVFADVRVEDGNLDPDAVKRALTRRTRAVLATHLFGHPCDLDALRALCREAGPRGLALIEDAAQAHGGAWRGASGRARALGSVGDFGAFSFYPTKNLGGIGDAGAILLRRKSDADRLRRLRDHGQRARFHPEEPGLNARMDALHAAFLRLKLPGLEGANARRAAIAGRYLRALEGHPSLVPLRPDARGASAWHAFVVRASNRRAFARDLETAGIGHQVYYPKALPDLPVFGKVAGPFPGARELARTALALPLHAHLGASAEGRIRAALGAF